MNTRLQKAPNIDWTEDKDHELIKFAYMGLILEGLAEQMNMTGGQVSGRLKFFGLTLDKVRQSKREGKTLAEMTAMIDERRKEAPDVPPPQAVIPALLEQIAGQQQTLIDLWGRLETALREASEAQQSLFASKGADDHAATPRT